jgi:hypothetical protein
MKLFGQAVVAVVLFYVALPLVKLFALGQAYLDEPRVQS